MPTQAYFTQGTLAADHSVGVGVTLPKNEEQPVLPGMGAKHSLSGSPVRRNHQGKLRHAPLSERNRAPLRLIQETAVYIGKLPFSMALPTPPSAGTTSREFQGYR